MDRLLALLIFTEFVSPAFSLPTGAAPVACEYLLPVEVFAPQSSDPPYEIVIDAFQDPSGLYHYRKGVTYTGEGSNLC